MLSCAVLCCAVLCLIVLFRPVCRAVLSHAVLCCAVFCCAGRLADMASQMGVSQATGPLGDLSKGVQGMASMLGGQVRIGMPL